MRWIQFLFLGMTFFSPLVLAAGLTEVEQKIAVEAKQQTEEAIRLLEETANINSGTMNPEGVRKVGEIFRARFDALGFTTKWIPMDHVNRAGHLVAERKGKKGKTVLLIGHLDTVFEKENPFQPFVRDGMKAKGQGVVDDKGGDVVIFAALKALHNAGQLEDTNLIVFFTGDEESAGEPQSAARVDLIEAGKRSDYALGFEGAIGLEKGTVARRGIGSWTLKVTGKQAHSSGMFSEEDGAGAVYEAARILSAFYKELGHEKYLTINPGVLVGGTETTYDAEQSRGTAFGKTNVIARTVTVDGDLRYISREQQEKARGKMRKIVKQNLPQTSAEITFVDGYPAMPPTDGNYKLLQQLDQVSVDLGHGNVKALDPGERGAGDISFVASDVDAALDGMGASGEGSHTPEEVVDLSTLPALIQRAALLIYRLTR